MSLIKKTEYGEYTVILNSSNIIPNSNNSQLVYKFDTPVEFKDSHLSINQITLFKSWFNIRQFVNDTFTYYFLNDQGDLVPYTMTFQPGSYKVNDIQEYIESKLVETKHYWIDETNKKIYPIMFLTNSVFYSIQLILKPIPPNGSYSKPAGSTWNFKQEATGIQLIIPEGFGKLVGLSANSYPVNTQTTTYSVLSNQIPQMSGGISNLIVRCNVVNMGQFSSPSDLCHIITSNGISFGSQIVSEPKVTSWQPIINGQYSNIIFTISNTDLSRVDILDPELTLTFKIRKPI